MTDRGERAGVPGLVAGAHRVQGRAPAVRAEPGRWACPRHDDGVPRGSRAAERPPGEDHDPDPLVVVLCSFSDGPLAELRAGQALQRVLLTAADLGLSATDLSRAAEARSVREELRRSVGGVVPQAVLRVGFRPPVPPTPRRAAVDLLSEAVDAP
ncbi:hypothetical protein [Saccharothrix algeriensis]|uniref:Nitroreductase domain-containing protein n=1 Tax=Saccharothrix algeriensis TaxID=173560 RepID=A0ABS2SEH8_9PSEU|nr:hypothetical protein [Saccharothrix algeriensis]MBM7814633.1 hypothetical protein [Saccharothrix algeriensis]